MSAAVLNQQRVYDAVIAAVEEAEFFPVTRDPTTGHMELLPQCPGVRPGSVVLNEVISTTRPASRNRRSMAFEVDRWVWELILKFDQEVSVKDLERRMQDSGILVQADRSRGLPQVRVELEESPYEHPPQGQPSNGTTVRFTLNARVNPK